MTDRSIQTDAQPTLFPENGDKVIYDHPLTERIRSLLRLEHLFNHIDARINGASPWDSRSALATIIDISEMLSRSDLKTDMMKELERQASVLKALQKAKNVDRDLLRKTLDQLNDQVSRLKDPGCQPAQRLRMDPIVSSVKQRIVIPGGTCSFDLPRYHYWLNLPTQQRIRQLQMWMEDLDIIKEGSTTALTNIRASASPEKTVALGGFFQKTLDPEINCHIVRIILSAEASVFPEVSGGKHRFSIRFLEFGGADARSSQADQDIEFELMCCVL